MNDYLARAIDARSIDRLRSEHCKRFFLSFRDKEIEVNLHKYILSIKNSSESVDLVIDWNPFPSTQIIMLLLLSVLGL